MNYYVLASIENLLPHVFLLWEIPYPLNFRKKLLIMRKRNIKINVFLNVEEKKMLEEKSRGSRLSQSNFIRNLIKDFNYNNFPNTNVDNLTNTISSNINDLYKLKNQIHYLGYFREEELLQSIIDSLNELIVKEPK